MVESLPFTGLKSRTIEKKKWMEISFLVRKPLILTFYPLFWFVHLTFFFFSFCPCVRFSLQFPATIILCACVCVCVCVCVFVCVRAYSLRLPVHFSTLLILWENPPWFYTPAVENIYIYIYIYIYTVPDGQKKMTKPTVAFEVVSLKYLNIPTKIKLNFPPQKTSPNFDSQHAARMPNLCLQPDRIF
jgi:hypothetical protein